MKKFIFQEFIIRSIIRIVECQIFIQHMEFLQLLLPLQIQSIQEKQNPKQMINSARSHKKPNQISQSPFLSDRSAQCNNQNNEIQKTGKQNDEVQSQKSQKSTKSVELPKGRLWIFQSLMSSIVPSPEIKIQRLCTICEQFYKPDQLKEFGKCKHSYCQGCLKQYIKHKIDTFQLITCPQEQCEQKLDKLSQMYKDIFSEDDKARYNRVELQLLILSDPNLRLCKNQQCEGILNLNTWKQQINQNAQLPITCSKCLLEYCKQCYEARHEGVCEKNIIKFLERNKKFRQCSKCKRVIQKSQGCTHMTCLCGHYFCYMCGQHLTTTMIHQCIIPNNLNCLQKVRWQIEHKQMFYESNFISFHKCLYCFDLPVKIPSVLRLLYGLLYTLTIYPITIVLFLTLIGTFFALLMAIFIVILLFLPFSEICSHKDFALTQCIYDIIGSFGLAVAVIIFYPIFIMAIIFEIFSEWFTDDDIHEEAIILFTEVGIGLRNVLLMPLVLCVNPQNLDTAQQALNQRIQNGV